MTIETRVFVRDDDLGRPCPALDRFHRMFADRDIPVAYQVVPAFLDEATAAEARAMHAARPDLVELHQHGTHHREVLDGEEVWSEFAGDAPRAEQQRTIQEGRARLTDLLGDHFDPAVFTPPAHKYGPDTLAALEALGVRTVSVGVHTGPVARLTYLAAGRLGRRVRLAGRTISHHGRVVPGSSIREWSCAIDVDQDGRGNRVSRSAEQLATLFADARAHLDVVGLMFHHEGYTDDAKFTAAERFLDDLVADPTVSFTRLGDL